MSDLVKLLHRNGVSVDQCNRISYGGRTIVTLNKYLRMLKIRETIEICARADPFFVYKTICTQFRIARSYRSHLTCKLGLICLKCNSLF
jgi:hypothetical protein